METKTRLKLLKCVHVALENRQEAERLYHAYSATVPSFVGVDFQMPIEGTRPVESYKAMQGRAQ
jgi:hypothetical protein